jgi:hypothetical protein
MIGRKTGAGQLLSHMQRIRYFIHETSAEDYYNRLARQLFSDLTYNLFVGVDFSEQEKTL